MKITLDHLKKQNDALLLRLSEAEETLNAIRNGEVDAIVMNGSSGEKIFSLTSVETPYRVIIENMSEGAVILSTDSLIVYCNQRFADMFEEPMEQIIGSNFLRFTQPAQPETYTSILKNGINKTFSKEITYVNKQKATCYFKFSFSALPPQIIGNVCAMVMDITELKENEKTIFDLNINLEAKIKQRTCQYEAVNKELEAFSYSVSHDLRAPLRAVNSYAQILIEDYGKDVNEDARTILENIKYNGKKMGNLIDELLAFSKLGRKEPTRELVNMDKLLEQVITDLGQVYHNLQHIIKISPLPTVKADNAMMYQVLYNLLSNAIKYSSKKENPTIEVYTTQKNNTPVFVVKDNGAGFDMQYADKLFDVFQRLHSEREFEGNGVGLAIVKRIITKFGGKVWAEAKLMQGASFYFSMPDG